MLPVQITDTHSPAKTVRCILGSIETVQEGFEGMKQLCFMLTGGRLLALLLCLCMPLSSALADDWTFSNVDRIVAVSDIHGAYDVLVTTFQAAGVIDDELNWNGAETHLVITGDLLDRGPDSRKVLDLIMRLERQAPKSGGRVHQLLGNHEVMNLNGDLRYVSDAEFAAFAGDESSQEREYWYRHFRSKQPADANEQVLRSEFDQKAPPGYFGHRRAYRSDGVYGKWLLEKPLMIVINDTLFVHGGAPPYVEEHGLAGVNIRLKTDLLDYVSNVSALQDASILSPLNWFKELPSILAEMMEAGILDNTLSAQAKAVLVSQKSQLHTMAGPLWYRGTAICNHLIEGQVLDRALEKVGAKRIVIGHTTTSTRRVQQRMSGRVIEIDTGMLKATYQGSGNALVIEEDVVAVVNQDGTDDLTPINHPQGVGNEWDLIDDDMLESILSNGTIIDLKSVGAAWRLLQIAAFDKTVFAYFNALPAAQGFAPEIAAYRLDRMLGLYMVPVTVRRDIAGQQGTLQFVPESTLSEVDRVAEGKGNRAICSMEKQRAAMHVYDALINNPARTPLSMLYDTGDWMLILVNHVDSFGTRDDRPAYLTDTRLAIGNEWRNALQNLDDEKLYDNLGDVLDKDRITALARRRDALIRDYSPE